MRFAAALQQRFAQAAGACGAPLELHHSIGGFRVRLRFANADLVAAMSSAMAHLVAPPVPEPDLTIYLFDTASTGIDLPPPSWSPGIYFSRPETAAGETFYLELDPEYRTLRFLAPGGKLAFFWIHDGDAVPLHESGAPLRTILHWWMSLHGRQYVHAGAVGFAEGGVLLAGPKGSGKSTATLACLGSALRFLGDDYCLVANDPEPRAFSLYSSAKLEAHNLDRFPHLRSATCNPENLAGEKALLFLHQNHADEIARDFPLHAILLPRVTGEWNTRLRPASAVDTLRALAPSTLFQLPGASRHAFRRMSELVKRLPCYHLELGTDLRQIPEAVATLLTSG